MKKEVKNPFTIWLILDLFVNVLTMLAVVTVLGNQFKGLILTVFIVLFIMWAFRPVWLAWKNFNLPPKKKREKKPIFRLEIENYNKASFWIQLISLVVIVVITVLIFRAQIPKPAVEHNFYSDENGNLGVVFSNYGTKPSSLINFTIIDINSMSQYEFHPSFPIIFYQEIQFNKNTNFSVKNDDLNSYGIIYYTKSGDEVFKFEFIPDVNRSVEIYQLVNVYTSVSVSITRYRNSSIIIFYKKPLNNYNTSCYIKNSGGNLEKYIITDLNFSTSYIPPNDQENFLCKINDGRINKIYN